MHIQQIRSATLIVTYGGKKFLVDPWLADKGTMPPVPSLHNNSSNPLVDLPLPLDEVVRVDAVIVTHLHFDHFDAKAREVLPKELPLFIQNEEEAQFLHNYGFKDVTVLEEEGTWFAGIRLSKTHGQHGLGQAVIEAFRQHNTSTEVCGVVLQHPEEKTLYIAGDTVWCPEVETALLRYQPEVIVVNAGHAQFADGTPIIMGAEDVYRVCQASPQAIVIASHMEAVNHARLSRSDLAQFGEEKGIASQLRIPVDGEVYTL